MLRNLPLSLPRLPLVQCKEKFSVMSLKFREGIIDQLQESARKFGVSHLSYTSFTATFGYRHKVRLDTSCHLLQS